MKATTFNVLSGDNWFQTNIHKAPTFAATLSAFFISAIRKTESLVQAVFVDRDPQDVDSKGKVAVGEVGFVDYPGATDAVTVMEMIGERDAETREITFGVGAVTPQNVKTALTNAVNGLAIGNQVHASFRALPGVPDMLKKIVSPSLAKTKLAEALNIAFDLVPLMRDEAETLLAGPARIVLVFDQDVNSGTIKLVAIPRDNLPNLAMADKLVMAEVTPPELASVTSASARNFGE